MGAPDARSVAEPHERKSSTKIRSRLESRRKKRHAREGNTRATALPARVVKTAASAIIAPEQSRSLRRREAHVRDVHVRKHEEARRADPCGTAFRAGCPPVVGFIPSSVRVSFVRGPVRAGHSRKIPAMYPHNPHLLSTNVSISVACGEVVHRHSRMSRRI